MRRVKIQLTGQFVISRASGTPLSQQIVGQLQRAIEAGRVAHGTQLPSSRALARTLDVSRNTVLTAFDELKARGLLRGRRGARMHAVAPSARPGLNVRRALRDAQYPSRTLTMRDQDGNPIVITYEA
jgi:GntR family transcriptional regulator/MocR family aminotransferase